MKFIKSGTWKSILFLLAILLIALVISRRFLSGNYQEGLLDSSAVKHIESVIDEYEAEIDTICGNGIKSISKIQMSSADSVTFSPILADDTMKNTAKLDKLISLKSTNDGVKKAIIKISGEKYVATLNLLHELNKEKYTDDETFTEILKQQNMAVQNVISGDSSAYNEIKSYLKTISNISA